MGRSRTSSYIVEYRLAFNDENPMSVLQKLDRIAAAIYPIRQEYPVYSDMCKCTSEP